MNNWILNTIVFLLLSTFLAIPVQKTMHSINNNTSLITEFDEEESTSEKEKEVNDEIEKLKQHIKYPLKKFNIKDVNSSNFTTQLFYGKNYAKIHLPPPQTLA